MKHIIILGDGMADWPVKSLGDKTLLQYAKTPYMDKLACMGRNGRLITVAEGFHPGSEVANMSVLGYDLPKVYEGRGPLEAASIGVDLQPGEIAMRCNLICVEGEILKNHSSGHISTEEADVLIKYLQENLGDDRVRFHTGVQYRHLLVIKGGNKELDCTPPHDVPLKPFRPLMVKPLVPEAQETADLINDLILKSQELLKNHHIDPNLYVEYNVKRGLRDSAGKGVLTGLTEISDVNGYNLINGRQIPADGRLYYQGINVQDIISGLNGRRFGFEETIYLLIFGKLPDKEELSRFLDMMSDMEELGGRFVRDVVMKGTNANIMNAMQRCVLALYTYDDNPEDISPENVLRQSLELIAKLPEIAVYSYHAYRHFRKDDTLFIRNPQKGLSLAENILLMLRPDGKYTELEAKVLDIALILHAEHGGGNNSTFTVRVTSSTGTDTYSAIAAGIGSLKGPLHGGANIQVADMFQHLKENIKDWTSVDEIDTYYTRMLNKEVYNKTGLIYGIGHAVYTISDPRALLLKELARDLAREKGRESEFAFLELLEERAIATFGRVKNNGKTVSSNIDFYSGFVYEMIGLPQEIFTPLFAMARIVGWCAHRNEELTFDGKRIIRPAYKNVLDDLAYIPIKKR